MSDVQDKIFDIIAKEASIDRSKITPSSTLKDLQIPSLDIVQIIFAIEDHFQINLPDDNASFDTDSAGDLVATVERLLAEKAEKEKAKA
jgi:acyl carrier protein